MLRIEITTIQDLMAFVSIVRGKDMNIDEIKQLTSIIDKNTTLLEDAVKQQQQQGGNIDKPSAG